MSITVNEWMIARMYIEAKENKNETLMSYAMNFIHLSVDKELMRLRRIYSLELPCETVDVMVEHYINGLVTKYSNR